MDWIKDCTETTEDQKYKYNLSDIAAAKARTGPTKSKRIKSAGAVNPSFSFGEPSGKPKTGRMQVKKENSPTVYRFNPEFTAVVSDGSASISAIGRCDGGSDESLASTIFEEKAAI